ncbi:penicillin acylase family protein [Hymenobacter sp. HSC-4F20]|uniref:penicillin acylase family protein n=1 Tax=Hymenobacter sp. HSC-4F20 TaxID=2864135 RepID=UPI001C734A74|nr:penicillin acylase family protein [Hymenobacter sp. HSC-4F20]MBX0292997.1 penicillin acylase family protein [Hymenobacter sp. HSC-4F20]
MKHYLSLAGLASLLLAWVWVSQSTSWGGNSAANIAAYHGGILSLQEPAPTPVLTLRTPVQAAQVYVDTLAIPHIFGKDAPAVAYALGYMHAKERYFQMELLSHVVSGRLAEMVGESGLGSDREWKPFEFERKGELILDSLRAADPALHAYLSAYSQGVNAYLGQEAPAQRDPMYLLFGRSPQAWKPYYSFLLQWYVAAQLSYYDDYIDKQELLDKLPEQVRRMLYPDYPTNHDLIVPASAGPARAPQPAAGNAVVAVFRPQQANTFATRPTTKSLGSNNWVVGPQRTASGNVLLCNDPHLVLTSPNIFYEVQLQCPSFHLYGYTIPGIPMVLTGHSNRIAWGVTNGSWDVTEQYVLRLNPQDSTAYWLDGRWQQMQTKDYRLQVKDGADEVERVEYSVFGRVVRKGPLVYALRWHPQYGTQAVQALWRVMQATNWQEFRTALRHYDYPSQNFVYGDVDGNIGEISAGRMPIKPARYAGGMLDGTTRPIQRYVPFDSLPQAYNPSQAYLFSANQEPQRGRYYYAAHWFEDLYRPRRIRTLLQQGSALTKDNMIAMQQDVVDLSVSDLKQLLQKYTTPRERSATWQRLAQWNGTLDATTKEALFYKCFRRSAALTAKKLADQLHVKTAPSFDQLLNFLLKYEALPVATGKIRSNAVFRRMMAQTDSLYQTASAHQAAEGAASTDLTYDFSVAHISSLPGLEMPVRGVGGSENTINVNYDAHSVIRTVVEIGPRGVASWMITGGGQSGRLNSRFYGQQLGAWKQNTVHPTQFVSTPAELTSISQQIHFVKH